MAMSGLYHAFIYQPLYNGLVFLLDTMPFADAGIAVIIFTIIIKIVLFPLTKKSIVTQIVMKEIQPDIDHIKTKYKNDKQEQARKIMDLYKERGVNPLSGVFLILTQLPILFALFQIFNSGLPIINIHDLYSFISTPQSVSMEFLGLFDISKNNNLALAILVALSQYLQAHYMSVGRDLKSVPHKEGSFQDDFARSMNMQMKYVMPLFIGFISYSFSGALAIYWITSNLFSIGQEIYMRKNKKCIIQKNGK